MKLLFVGPPTQELADYAQSNSPSAQLILPQHIGILSQFDYGYISIGDHNSNEFISVLKSAKEIFFVDNIWNQHQREYRTVLQILRTIDGINVTNLPKPSQLEFLTINDLRQTPNKQLWSVGCSVSHGIGVDEDQRWGQLLGIDLNLPVSFLTDSGTSISWASDQILRADIKTGDIVCWALTGCGRYTYYFDGIVNHITENDYKYFSEEIKYQIKESFLVTDHMIYTAITSIQQVVKNSLDKNYKLVLTQLPLNPEYFESNMLDYLVTLNQYTHFNKFIDLGNDNVHPGPKTHKALANLFYKQLTNN